MSAAANPLGGILATANNQPVPDGQGPFLGIDWIDGYRAARIFESLESRHDWDLAGVRALQMDQQSLPWRELREYVLATPANSTDARRGLALLKEWDGVVSADSPAAAVFEYFLAELSRLVAEAKFELLDLYDKVTEQTARRTMRFWRTRRQTTRSAATQGAA